MFLHRANDPRQRDGHLSRFPFDERTQIKHVIAQRAGTALPYVTLDRASVKIRKFRAFAEGRAWGAGTYTPSPPPGKFPLLFAVQETNDAFSKIVPPQGALDGPDYLRGIL